MTKIAFLSIAIGLLIFTDLSGRRTARARMTKRCGCKPTDWYSPISTTT